MKALRFYEIVDDKLREIDERVYRARQGSTIEDYFFLWNVGDEEVSEFTIKADMWYQLYNYGTEEEPWNLATMKLIQENLEFKAPNYWTKEITEYDVGGGLKPREWIRVPYRITFPWPCRFYFMIRVFLNDPLSISKFPWRYKKTIGYPYYNPQIGGKEFFVKLNLPHPPKFARWDYADLAIYAANSPTKISDTEFVPFVWLSRNPWSILAHFYISEGDVYGTKEFTLFCGAKLPFRNHRVSNPTWLKQRTPTVTSTISSWDLHDAGDFFIVRGDIRR